MSRLHRSLALWAALLLLLVPTTALAQEIGDLEDIADNEAIVANEEDGASLFGFAFDIVRVTDGIVDQTNLALAYSNCEACTTVAVAIQIVLVMGDVTTVTPENVAIAINDECSLCETFAVAYQFVVGIDEGPIHFTGDGMKRLAQIYKEISKMWDDLEDREMEPEDFLLALDALMDEVGTILDEELVPAGKPEPDPSISPSAEASTEPEPSASPSSDATPTPSAEPSTVEESPTPEASPTS